MGQHFDVVVIGGGPGGYVAAIRAAQLGLKAACCEENPYADPKGEPRLGGTCLNVGCIPSKALLHASRLALLAREELAAFGVEVEGVKVDVGKMMARKEAIVTQLAGGIRTLFRRNGVTFLPGRGRLRGERGDLWEVAVGDEVVETRHVVVATGSRPRVLPEVPVDGAVVCDHTGALSWSSVPERLVVIGAGVIGVELGSVWRRLGAEVTVVEVGARFLPSADADVARALQQALERQGMRFRFGCRVEGVQVNGERAIVQIKEGEVSERLEADRVLVAVGRVPYAEGAEEEGIRLPRDERGFVAVDEVCRTRLPRVWAIGDVVRGPMLAHKAMQEGVMVAERIAGQAGMVNYEAIPWVIYTDPEVAWVGKSEAELKASGVRYRVGRAPFAANGRALGMGKGGGFVKVLSATESDRILGVHVVGEEASELVASAVVGMEFSAAAEDLARICFAHPTLGEALHEAAAAAAFGRAMHC
ncbi:MAG: dihydrolipoyl dehydrogenase [Hydrogenophilus sp.]|nr:dihydrolipoyl dehydrogenase [Hydrogenophilus sp.]